MYGHVECILKALTRHRLRSSNSHNWLILGSIVLWNARAACTDGEGAWKSDPALTLIFSLFFNIVVVHRAHFDLPRTAQLSNGDPRAAE